MTHFENQEAEKALLGIILTHNDTLAEVTLSAEDFYLSKHQTIYKAMSELYSKRVGIDPVTLATHLGAERLKLIGGITYLMEATQAPATRLHAKTYAEDISAKSKNRQMAMLLTDMGKLIDMEPAEEVIKKLQDEIIVIQADGHSEMAEVPDIALEVIHGKPEKSIPTGFRTLDRVMKGLRKGRVVTIAGRPGAGKTAFSLRLLDQIPDGERAIYFSLEMGAREITERMMAAQTYTKLDKIINKTLDESEKARLIESKIMNKYNIKIDDSVGLSMDSIRAKARVEKIKHGLSVVFIDHIGLLNPSTKGMKAYERMTEISKGLKEMAKELDITVIALSQLNRSPADRKDGEPMLSDLRDSGSIEQDSDQVILLYNPSYQDATTKSAGGQQESEQLIAKIAKNRIGGIGQIAFDYYKQTQVIQEARI
jgi:replicative DNA helicase